ncbi:hypothetical protein [Streptomyces sp. NPDC048473]|uniref:hypothetical protein n=1 Tax=unclassified Streptomyces TaxID=2593676 RepID=UPI00372038DC
MRESTRLGGGDWTAARAESHATRSALTAPLLRVQLLMPTVASAAQEAAAAAYAMRGADDLTHLAGRRETAIAAGDTLVAAAARCLAA